MSSAIHALKVLQLQTQLDVDAKILNELEMFGYFVDAIYAKRCFEATVGAQAAANDIQLYKLLKAHEQIQVFKDIPNAVFIIISV